MKRIKIGAQKILNKHKRVIICCSPLPANCTKLLKTISESSIVNIDEVTYLLMVHVLLTNLTI